jgi:hypothetical protein
MLRTSGAMFSLLERSRLPRVVSLPVAQRLRRERTLRVSSSSSSPSSSDSSTRPPREGRQTDLGEEGVGDDDNADIDADVDVEAMDAVLAMLEAALRVIMGVDDDDMLHALATVDEQRWVTRNG